jgi:hypothetical protein
MRPATKSCLLLLKRGIDHLGILVNPVNKSKLDVTGYGKFEIIGKLRDKGYEFGPIKSEEFPKWMEVYIPQNYLLYSYCQVISVPFAHPNDCTCDDCNNKLLRKKYA